ncbi:hypothetical protein ACFL6S_07225 [Candidatus Poribacteria bacterium]
MLLSILAITAAAVPAAQPISLHPDNPHYFLFRGEPTILITSAEHYGAVLNLDFDYVPYLDEFQARGFNLTRIFTGIYVEHSAAFNIKRNTLAPMPGRFICPWARSSTPGYANGGNKFDLSKWDDDYFSRLKDFCQQASQRGIIVEVTLFCPYYGDEQWNISPMKMENNINGVGDVPREETLTMKHPALIAIHDAMTRKIVHELQDFDNIYYEICNEPYFGGVTLDWQAHIAATIVGAEAEFLNKHIIAQNINNNSAKIDNPNPAISLFNFHYAVPDAARENYGLNKAIGDDETGFKGTADLPYRTEAWHFLLAGGGLYNNLDYSFTAGTEDGTFELPDSQPGGGGPALRNQIETLKNFLYSFDFIKMAPGNSVVKDVIPEDAKTQVLAEPGKAYAIYIQGGEQATLELGIPAGKYRAEWLNTRTGQIDASQDVNHEGENLKLASPAYREDIALRLVQED